MRFTVGDVVKVRSWEDLCANHYVETDCGGELHIWEDLETDETSFEPAMKEYCGKKFVIAEAHERYKYYTLVGIDDWIFEDWMLDEHDYPIYTPCGAYSENDEITEEDVAGTIGEWFDNPVLSIPDEAIAHLREAYRVCVEKMEER